MKRLICLAVALLTVLALSACGEDRYQDEEPIGGDWHVWGMYDFMTAGELAIAVGKAYNEEKQQIGYDIYADGESQGPLLCSIRCTDGGFAPDELDYSAPLRFEDVNGDGSTDIGAAVKGGDVMWYLQDEESGFTYFETRSYGVK